VSPTALLRLLVCAFAAVALPGCGDNGPKKGDPRDGGRLVVREVHRQAPHGETYIEGAIQFVELTPRGERKPSVKFRRGDKPVARVVEPGEYRLVSYTRSCSASCSTALDEPVDHCSGTLSIKHGERTTLEVVTIVGRRCTIHAEPR
jgi:hypothetical protein